MMSIVDQGYWDTGYADLPLVYNPDDIEFTELFDRYLKPKGTCFEIGCYPGNFLIYLGKRFDYVMSGIDTTPYVLSRLQEHLINNGVKISKLYHGDFLSFQSEEVYDVVCSFGFIEHFSNFEGVIERHIQLVKPGGILILSCPNFRGMQYVLHRLLDPVNLRRHIIKAMSLHRWKRVLESNGMKIIYQGYYRTVDFWVETPPTKCWAPQAIKWIKWAAKQVDQRVNWPHLLFSPYMISFSRKCH